VLLGKILTEVQDELMAERGPSDDGDVLAVGLSIEPVANFGELQRKCPESCISIEYLEKGTLPSDQKWQRRLEHNAQNFFMKDRKLWHRQTSTGRRHSFQDTMIQLVVFISERKDVLHGLHGLSHLGFNKTYEAVSRVYFWYHMYKDLKTFIRTCPDCQTSKCYHKYNVFLKPLVIRPGFGHTLHLDYSGPYPDSGKGDRYVCAVVDSYSSYCWLFATTDMTSGSAVRCLLHVVSQIGAFHNLISDRAAAFLGVVMTSFLELFDIKKISTSSYNPKSNSKIERLQRTLIECLKATCVEGRPWASALIFVQMALRSAPVNGLGLSPFELTSGGYRMNLPMDMVKIASFDEGHQHPNDIIKGIRVDLDLMSKIVREHIAKNQREIKLTFDEKVSPYSSFIGSIVLLNDPVEKSEFQEN